MLHEQYTGFHLSDSYIFFARYIFFNPNVASAEGNCYSFPQRRLKQLLSSLHYFFLLPDFLMVAWTDT